jgi:hypothetical protein
MVEYNIGKTPLQEWANMYALYYLNSPYKRN